MRESETDLADRVFSMKVAPVLRGIAAVIAALIAAFLMFIALLNLVDFVHVDGRNGLGNAGYLMVVVFYLVLAGPFVGIAVVLGLPLISDDPKYRPGKTFRS